MHKYSIANLVTQLRENKHLVEAYLRGTPVEGYRGNGTIMGMTVAAFLVLFTIAFGIWVWATIALIRYWPLLPDWGKLVGLLSLLPVVPIGGPVVTLAVVYITKAKTGTPTSR